MDIRKLETKNKKFHNNLTKKEYVGLKQLREDENVIIKPADKGGGVVILNMDQYHQEMSRLLSDLNTYQKLPGDPTAQTKQIFFEYLQRGKNTDILNDREYQYLKMEHPRIPVIYYLPKFHKNKTNPPGRPIVSGINSITSRISEYIDLLLQPLVVRTQAYLKDTISLLRLLEEIEWKDNYIMATCDVNSLYTIIPHDVGCEATRFFLSDSGCFAADQMEFIIEGIQLVLNNNYFWYKGDFYLQINGTAMGTRFAPSYANLFMAYWESQIACAGHDWGRNLVLYRRYIDDVLIVWEGSHTDLVEFIAHLNDNSVGIKLDSTINKNKVDFLDLTLYTKDGRILTKTHFKDVHVNGYIDRSSDHYPPWLNGIPKGQMVRVRRNCSDVEQYQSQSQKLIHEFVAKGYEKQTLNIIKEDVLKMERSTLLVNKQQEINKEDIISFILDYHVYNREIRNSIVRHWPILKRDSILNTMLPDKPSIIYRGGRSAGRQLVKNHIIEKKSISGNPFGIQAVFYGCGQCIACRKTSNKKRTIREFASSRTDSIYKIQQLITRHSKNVIYLFKCPCGKNYVGQTSRPLYIRINEHLCNIARGYEKHSVPLHFRDTHNCSLKNIQFFALEVVKRNWRGEDLTRKLIMTEMRWIYTLDTLIPGGLNADFEISHFLK
uniref:Reverse transcriptase domain-containing protein n=1 Tax=Leptobrachium leishanense TaxID=445787 RepID=A0A8C5MIH2_9ANUR